MTVPDPADHRCDVPTIDYSLVAKGYLVCDIARGGCGREWRLVPLDGSPTAAVWNPSPRPVGAPRRFAEAQRAGERARRVSTGAGPW